MRTPRLSHRTQNVLLGTAVIVAFIELAMAVVLSVTPVAAAPSGGNNTPPLVDTFNIQAPMVANAFGTQCYQQNVYESRWTSNRVLIQTFIFGAHWCSRFGLVISGTKWWCKVGSGTLVIQYDPCSANFGTAGGISREFGVDWDPQWIGRPDLRYDVDMKGRLRADGVIFGSIYANLGYS